MRVRHKALAALILSSMFSSLSMAADSTKETQTAPAPAFTPEQEARIGQVAAEYLVAHPEVLMQASRKLQEQQQAQTMQAMTTAAVTHHAALTQGKLTPSYGPADAPVVVVQFFDYQ